MTRWYSVCAHPVIIGVYHVAPEHFDIVSPWPGVLFATNLEKHEAIPFRRTGAHSYS